MHGRACMGVKGVEAGMWAPMPLLQLCVWGLALSYNLIAAPSLLHKHHCLHPALVFHSSAALCQKHTDGRAAVPCFDPRSDGHPSPGRPSSCTPAPHLADVVRAAPLVHDGQRRVVQLLGKGARPARHAGRGSSSSSSISSRQQRREGGAARTDAAVERWVAEHEQAEVHSACQCCMPRRMLAPTGAQATHAVHHATPPAVRGPAHALGVQQELHVSHSRTVDSPRHAPHIRGHHHQVPCLDALGSQVI